MTSPTASARTVPVASSITHVHLTAVVNTEIAGPARSVRLLDAGCGDGAMLEYLIAALEVLRPQMSWELYGFDILDGGVQADCDFLTATRSRLGGIHPHVDWLERITGIASSDPWPYDDEFFDVIISNQVLEHVADLDFFLSQLHRTLRPGGVSAHIFPLRAVISEGHVGVPLAHRIRNHDLSRWYLEAANRLGIGRYDTYNDPGDSLREFAAKEADRLWNYTSYRSYAAVLIACRRAGLRASFRYTPEFYRAKLRSLGRIEPVFTYDRHALSDWLGARMLQYVSGVSLFAEKTNDVPSAHRGDSNSRA